MRDERQARKEKTGMKGEERGQGRLGERKQENVVRNDDHIKGREDGRGDLRDRIAEGMMTDRGTRGGAKTRALTVHRRQVVGAQGAAHRDCRTWGLGDASLV